MAECLSDHIIKAGHECRLITPVTSSEIDNYSFPVYRNPGLINTIKLILWSDIVYSNGASLALLPLSKILFRPFVWKHAGYQASCIDGLGWVNGRPAPMNPWKSILFHLKNSGFVYALSGAVKLFIRRIAANCWVDMNVAITEWVSSKQRFKKQIVIYNPSPIAKFSSPLQNHKPKYNFVYLGRLVSEKGVGTLLNAMALLVKKYPDKNLQLLIIGDGNIQRSLEKLSEDLAIKPNVTFAGKKKGQELTNMVQLAPVAIVPSEWEEPMGIVALELMASGRVIIVSERGGLKECIGKAGLTFPNGNYHALSDQMESLLMNEELVNLLQKQIPEQLKKFNPEKLTNEYINLFNRIINNKKFSSN